MPPASPTLTGGRLSRLKAYLAGIGGGIFSEALQQLYQQLEQVQVVVVVSPTAVEIGMRYPNTGGITLERLAHIQWIAVWKNHRTGIIKFNIKK